MGQDVAGIPTRVEAIDQFRGLAILGMVLVNYLGGVRIVPTWLKHAPDVGLTVADLVAPFFILAIGLTYGLSARRRLARDGRGKTAVHFFTRWMPDRVCFSSWGNAAGDSARVCSGVVQGAECRLR